MKFLLCLVAAFTALEFSYEYQIIPRCGNKSVVRGFIRKGNETSQNEWPWLANIIYKKKPGSRNEGLFCGATLISLKSVLTAAHCMQDKFRKRRLNPGDFEVHLGRHDLRDDNELNELGTKLHPIVIIAMHPDWIPTNFTNFRYDADIALLIANQNIEYSPYISPICLPGQVNANDIDISVGTTVGWGFSSDDAVDVENKPRQAEVLRVSPEKCFLEEKDITIISSLRTFCARGVKAQEGPCLGDSGGGFYFKNGNVWSIQGIVSSGILSDKCPQTTHSVFTKLSSFKSWIQEGLKKFYAVPFTYKFRV